MNSFGAVRLSALAAILAASALNMAQQSKPVLRIDSPADGAVVNPGQTIRVRVTSPTGAAFSALGVIGPIGVSEVARSVPAEFSMTIPSNISACRRYSLAAQGKTTAGESVDSDPIDLDVERPDTPISLWSQFESLTLEVKSLPFPMMLTATFSDGKVFEVTESSYVTYESSNTAVATVNKFGATTAVAPGTASIRITYKNPKGGSVQLSLPVTVCKSDCP